MTTTGKSALPSRYQRLNRTNLGVAGQKMSAFAMGAVVWRFAAR
jgi:hypothetical protein